MGGRVLFASGDEVGQLWFMTVAGLEWFFTQVGESWGRVTNRVITITLSRLIRALHSVLMAFPVADGTLIASISDWCSGASTVRGFPLLANAVSDWCRGAPLVWNSPARQCSVPRTVEQGGSQDRWVRSLCCCAEVLPWSLHAGLAV